MRACTHREGPPHVFAVCRGSNAERREELMAVWAHSLGFCRRDYMAETWQSLQPHAVQRDQQRRGCRRLPLWTTSAHAHSVPQ